MRPKPKPDHCYLSLETGSENVVFPVSFEKVKALKGTDLMSVWSSHSSQKIRIYTAVFCINEPPPLQID